VTDLNKSITDKKGDYVHDSNKIAFRLESVLGAGPIFLSDRTRSSVRCLKDDIRVLERNGGSVLSMAGVSAALGVARAGFSLAFSFVAESSMGGAAKTILMNGEK
jgi:hypothetical protein